MSADLRKQLEALHGELARTTSVDSDSQKLLVTLLDDISRLLATRPGPATANAAGDAEEPSMTERLDELAVQFEAEHPSLGAAIRRVVDTLAKAGI